MFKVKFLEEAKEFLDSLDEKPREKIFSTFGNLKY
jgi:mRNA-degrading endonuclease RelE of RelBE toxin-antitoxin system